MKCENELEYRYRNRAFVFASGKQDRTYTLKYLTSITVYEVGTAVPNHTRCTLHCPRSTELYECRALIYRVSQEERT